MGTIAKDAVANEPAVRHAIVSGGSRGIGAAIALALARERINVALLHHADDQAARETCATIETMGRSAFPVECDVADESQVRSAVDAVVARFGFVDILVNCAGVGLGEPFEALDTPLWDKVIGVNLTGAYFLARACYPAMMARRRGWIINIASQMAIKGCLRGTAYCASKAGLIGFTRALALEAAEHNVLVNCVAPGATNTSMLAAGSEVERAALIANIPLGRFAEAHEIAASVSFLVSEGGSFFVGQTLSPNGGDVFV